MSNEIEKQDTAELWRQIQEFLESTETCHICQGVLSLDDVGPTHCENCSWDCDEHDGPECPTVQSQHQQAKRSIAALKERMEQAERISGELLRALEENESLARKLEQAEQDSQRLREALLNTRSALLVAKLVAPARRIIWSNVIADIDAAMRKAKAQKDVEPERDGELWEKEPE